MRNELLKYLDYVDKKADDRGLFITAEDTKSYRLHTHSFYEVILYEPFEGKTTINGQDFIIDTPTIILITPWDIHGFDVSVRGRRSIKLNFLSNKIEHIIDLPKHAIILSNLCEDDFIVKSFIELYNQNQNTEYAFLLTSLIVKLLSEQGKKLSLASTIKGHNLTIKAIHLLNSQFTDEITLDDIAKQIGVSPQYLSTIFKRETGSNFIDYLCKLRLDFSKKLLKNVDNPISEICFQCGYRNLSHFLRSFKQAYGCTPKEYRNKNLDRQ